MRLHIVFFSDHPVILPWHYPHLLQGFLYGAIAKASPKLGDFLHDQGFTVGSHRYKMLVFSWLYPRRARSLPEGLSLIPPVHWWVSSPLSAPMEALATSLLKGGEVILGASRMKVEKVEVEPLPELSGRVLCETISPLVASTGLRKGDKLHKRFLSPDEPDFWRVLDLNCKRKAAALGLLLPEEEAGIRFEMRGKWRSKLLRAHGTQVRGYEGRFVMEGEKRLLLLAYEAGLGERNSQGFGMFRVLRAETL